MSFVCTTSQLQVLLDHRVLEELVAAPLEAALAERRAQRRQVAAARRARRVRRRAGGVQRRPLRRRCRGSRCTGSRWRRALRCRAWCCRGCPARSGSRRSASPFPGGCPSGGPARRRGSRRLRLAVVAAVLLLDVRGHATAAFSCSVSTLGDDVALVVEQVALAVLLEDGAEDPAVAVEVGELRVLGLRVQVGRRWPGTPGRTRGRVTAASSGLFIWRLDELLGGRVLLLARDTSARRRSPRPTTCSRGSCS